MALISYLTEIHFDFGAVRLLGDELRRLGVERPLLITDRGIAAAGLLERVAEHLPRCPVFDGTPANPTETAAKAATLLFRAEACDGIVALGGGSPIDLAKAVALLATHPEPLPSYTAVNGGMSRIGPGTAPLIAIPTTAGSGSEVGRAAVIVMNDGRKLAVISPHLLPVSAICDAELTLSLPPRLTAATGMDAVAHCIETLLSPRVNPPAEAIAVDGLARAVKHIERATNKAGDRTARYEMMMASLAGGLAFQKGLGAVHAMSHPLGALREPALHHGTLNAVLLPAVLRFNAAHAGDKYARMRNALGLGSYVDLADFFGRLNERLGMPRDLAEMGVCAEMLPALAEAAEKDLGTQTNPRPVNAANYLALYREALTA